MALHRILTVGIMPFFISPIIEKSTYSLRKAILVLKVRNQRIQWHLRILYSDGFIVILRLLFCEKYDLSLLLFCHLELNFNF